MPRVEVGLAALGAARGGLAAIFTSGAWRGAGFGCEAAKLSNGSSPTASSTPMAWYQSRIARAAFSSAAGIIPFALASIASLPQMCWILDSRSGGNDIKPLALSPEPEQALWTT
jgi:hypothetical protein